MGNHFGNIEILVMLKTTSVYKSWNTKYSGHEAGTCSYDKRRNEYRISIRINERQKMVCASKNL
jgi:hypothetical protein